MISPDRPQEISSQEIPSQKSIVDNTRINEIWLAREVKKKRGKSWGENQKSNTWERDLQFISFRKKAANGKFLTTRKQFWILANHCLKSCCNSHLIMRDIAIYNHDVLSTAYTDRTSIAWSESRQSYGRIRNFDTTQNISRLLPGTYSKLPSIASRGGTGLN